MLTLNLYKELVSKMIIWAKAYYKDGTPHITDSEWDINYRSLFDFEKTHPEYIDVNSPVGKVGYATFNGGGTITHFPPMLSLRNAMDINEAAILIKNIKTYGTRVIELKADGIACRLHYKGGKYAQALTRGDGVCGEDITRHISPDTSNIPRTVKFTKDIIVDGELVIKYADFKTLNEYRVSLGKEPYKNTRNAVAGMMSNDELDPIQKAAISFVAYELHGNNALTWSANRDVLEDNGFELVGICKGNDFETIAQSLAGKRQDLPYMIDGLVVKLDIYTSRDKLGATNHSPRWAFSYKFPAATNKTVLESIGFTVGRTGQITGMAYFNPIDIGGVTVSKSAIDSVERWRELRPSKGAILTISRRADVRPYVETCESVGGAYYAFTALCPWCNTALTEKGKKVFCTNHTCLGRNIAHITYAVSKTALDIEDLSEQKITMLCSLGVINYVTSLYSLTTDMLMKAGFTKYSSEKMIKQINASKETTLERVIISLGIPLIARTISKIIADYMRDNKIYGVDGLIDLLLKPHEVEKIPMGVAAKKSICDHFAIPHYVIRAELYKNVGFKLKTVFGSLTGMRFCITGSLMSITRGELEKQLLRSGATLQSSVTKETTALITDDKCTPPWENMPSAKMQKAVSLNVKIITSKEAIVLLSSGTF